MSHETERGAEEVDDYNDDPLVTEGDCMDEPDGGPPLSHRRLSMRRSVITGPEEEDDDQPCVRAPDGGYVITGRYGSSAMAASARDLILILKDLASSDPRLLRPESVDRMATAQPTLLGTSYGLGFDTAEFAATGLGQLSKSGEQNGTRTLAIISQRRGVKVGSGPYGTGGDFVHRWTTGLSLCLLTNKNGWKDEEGNELGPTIQSLGSQIIGAIQGLAPATADSPPWGKYDLSEGLKGEDRGHL